MPFTLRQLHGAVPPLVLWLLISLLCAISGPFGTHEGFGLLGRLVYWGCVVGLSILGTLLINRLALHKPWQKIFAWTLFALSIASGVYLVNGIIFGEDRTGGLFYLIAIVGATVLVVHGMLWLAYRSFGAPAVAGDAPDTPDATVRFLRRLPIEARGPLVRIEAQDHYLNVVTTKGSALILLRLSEAVEELEGAKGLQTHRSHWVLLEAVTAHRRVEGRDVLVMSDGAEVPVARTRRQAAKDAGLF